MESLGNGLPTDENLRKCGVPIISKCECCGQATNQNSQHLFSYSEVTWKAWTYFGKMFGSTWKNIWSWKQQCLTSWEKTKGLNQFQILAKSIPNLLIC